MKNKYSNFSPLVFYEQSVIDGHPTHPTAKTRLGFSEDDLLKYSPECRTIFSLKICAIKKGYCQEWSLNTLNTTEFILNYDKITSLELKNELSQKKISLDDYRIFFIHPWQWDNIIEKNYSTFIKEDILIGLETNILSTPLISLRSLSLIKNNNELSSSHIKMSLSILTTSDIRVLTGRAVESGIEISKIVQNIQEKMNEKYGLKFYVLKETLGACVVNPNETESYPNRMSDRFSFLFRENPECFLDANEIAVPCASLVEKSPFSTKKIGEEFIEEYSKYHNLELNSGVFSFFQKYVDISLPGFLIYLTKYGLSLEGHAQNTIITFKNGSPTQFFVRDLSDIRISKQRLAQQGQVFDLSYKNSAIFCTEISKLQKNVFYSYIQGNLSEIILQISYIYNIDEEDLWNIVRLKVEETFGILALEPELLAAINEDKKTLLHEEEIAFKAVLRMRMKNELSNYEFEYVKNPLYSSPI